MINNFTFNSIQIKAERVTKKSGRVEPFYLEKVQRHLAFCASGLGIDCNDIATQCQTEIYDLITTKDITKTLVLSARSFIEKDPSYSYLTARILLYSLYKELMPNLDFGNLRAHYRDSFKRSIKTGATVGKLDPKLLLFDLDKLAENLEPKRDELFQYLGFQTLYDRYLLRNPENNQVLETPQMFWMRVAMGLAINEKDRDNYAIKFYNAMSQLLFLPSTPTLFHSGTNHPQLSSCYISTIEDSLDHIFKCIADNAQLSKWSGGIGNDWTNLRGMGAFIHGTSVESQGIVPFLKIANDTTVAINRSGKRRGATCAYLETWHIDIEDFLELRRNTGDERRRTHDMDIANWVPDLFMDRVIKDKNWTLFSPDETPDLHHIYGQKFKDAYEKYEAQTLEGKIKLFKTVRAKDLWKKMITMLFETGHPWITFKDPCNVRSPQDHVGVVHSSNLCTEITLNTSPNETAVCNLGSINLSHHINNQTLDVKLLKETVAIAMRMLDNAIDINFYPTKESKTANLAHRPVGLGVMGFQDVLYSLNIPFDSEAHLNFADETMEKISYFAFEASSMLARERGSYSSFSGSKWDRGILPFDTLSLLEKERGEKFDLNMTSSLDWETLRRFIKQYGLRNSNCMAIAPTATISNIAGCCPSIEPIYKNIYTKSNMSGEFTVINSYLVDDLKKINLWNDEMLRQIKKYDGNISQINEIPEVIKQKYKEAFEISPEWIIKAAARRGKWIDQSQSINLFIKGASGSLISEAYLFAWKMGLKTTYYLRTLSASSIEKSTLEIKQQGDLTKSNNSEMLNSTPKLCKINDPTCEACQ